MKKVISLVLFVMLIGVLQAEVTKIGFVGNSITQGSGLANPGSDSYPGQVDVFLPDSFEVSNFGLHSRTMLKHGDYPYWDVQEFSDALAYQADIVFILLGTNDSKPYNWDVYSEEYYDDCNALIDTLSSGEIVPEIWLCLPPPAFSVQFDIRDSVIVNGIIPIHQQIIAERGLKSIDFYSTMLDKRDMFQDDIHPTPQGAEFMAKLIYEALLGDTIQEVQDINLAKLKPVTVSLDAGTTGDRLVDGEPLSYWAVPEIPAEAVFDLGTIDTVDAFSVHFPLSSEAGIQYTIETSVDSINWQVVVDQSARQDVEQVASADLIEPLGIQYIRLTLTGVVDESQPIAINEFQALKCHGYHHAGVMTEKLSRSNPRIQTYETYFTHFNKVGEMFKIYRDIGTGFLQVPGFQDTDYTSYRTTVRDGQEPTLYIVSYLNGVEVVSTIRSLFKSTISQP